MRLICGLLENMAYQATLQVELERAGGRTVIVLENHEILYPEDASFGRFSLEEATVEEREQLEAAGYALPDFDPGQSHPTLQDLKKPSEE